MRTAYLKVADMDAAVVFWEGFFGTKPPKRSAYWSEFKCQNINFGLLWEEGFSVAKNRSNFVPVFEFPDAELEPAKAKALGLGARVVVDIADHPDGKSYVMADPWGNEFEVTRFKD